MALTVIDIVILILFIPAIIKGIKNGFLGQIAGIGGIILGIWLGYKFSDMLSTYLVKWINASEQIVKIISFAAIVVVVILLVMLIMGVVEKAVNVTILEWLNKLLGVIFACCATILIIGLIISLINYVNATWFTILPQEKIDESVLYKPISEIADKVFPYLKNFFKISI